MSKVVRRNATNFLLLMTIACGIVGCGTQPDHHPIPNQMPPTYFPS